jgi:nitroreductase
MTTDPTRAVTVDDLSAVVQIAERAPSVHNTQPWSWRAEGAHLELWADRDRWLPATDPDRHDMYLSCGAALRLARLGLDAAGWAYWVDRLPDRGEPDLLARISVTGTVTRRPDAQTLLDAALHRRSDRRPLDGSRIDDGTAESLRRAGRDFRVTVHLAQRAEEILDLAVVTGWSDSVERSLDDIKAELSRWVRADDASADGVPASAIPQSGEEPTHRTVPQRDFEAGVRGELQAGEASDADDRPLLAVLLTGSDSKIDQLRAGEALAELLIVAQRLGLSACPVSQPVDLPAGRARLRTLMGWEQHPQMVIRLGIPLAGQQPPLTPRRAVELDGSRTPVDRR